MDLQKPSKLIKDLKASKFLPTFDESLIKQLIDDINKHYFELLRKTMKDREELKLIFDKDIKFVEDIEERKQIEQEKNEKEKELYSRIVTLHTIILRYKRQECFWEFSNNLPLEYKGYLKSEEVTYFNEYKDLVFKYQKEFQHNINLTKDIEPPEDLFVSIRVIKECGNIISSDGDMIRLKKDQLFFLKRQDIEHLLLQGFVILN